MSQVVVLPDEEEIESRSKCWSRSATVWALWAGLAMFFVLYGWSALNHQTAVIRVHGVWHHVRPWMQTRDVWPIIDGGRFVWNGSLGYVYQGTSSYALPLSFILSAPVAGLMDHLQLVEGSPYPVAEPTAWLLVAPCVLACGLPLLVAVRRLAWQLGLRRRLSALQVACVPLALFPAFYWGHFDDVLALAFVTFAVRRLLRSEWIPAALLLSAGVASKQWAVMLVPLFVLLAPPGRRLRCLIAACALPGVLTLYVLGVDWSHASKALFSPVNAGTQTQGHLSFYASWFGSQTSKYSRTAGFLFTVPLAWLLRRSRGSAQMLASIGAVLLVRPFSEAISFSYYWSPGLLMAGLVGLACHKRFRLHDWVGPVAAALWATPRSGAATTVWWWAGELLLLGVTGWQVLRACGLFPRSAQPVSVVVKKTRYAPIFPSMNTARAVGDTSWTR